MLNMPMPIVICGTAKGGSAKTTLSVNLAACLAERALKPLIIDLDAQGDASDLLGQYDPENFVPMENSCVHLMNGNAAIPINVFGIGLVAYRPELNSLSNMMSDISVLKNYLRGVKRTIEEYKPDIVFIDTPPSQTVAGYSAFAAASHLIVPLMPVKSSYKGALNMFSWLDSYNEIQRGDKTQVIKTAVVPIGESNTKNCKNIMGLARETFGDLLTSTISHRSVVTNAGWENLPVRYYERMQLENEPPYARGKPQYRTVGNQFMAVAEQIAKRLNLTLKELPPELKIEPAVQQIKEAGVV